MPYPLVSRPIISRPFLSFLLVTTIVIPAFAAEPSPITQRLAQQNALFEEQYQADLKASPERATAFGDYRYNDQLDDESLAALA